MRSLILAGGGIKVGFQAGVLQVWLDEAGIEFDHADGASDGRSPRLGALRRASRSERSRCCGS